MVTQSSAWYHEVLKLPMTEKASSSIKFFP